MQALQLLNKIFRKIVILNKEAQHMLFDRNPRWYAAMTNAIPEAIFKPCLHPPIQRAAKLIKK